LNVTGETFRACDILSNKLTGWLAGAVSVFPNVIVASFVMLVFWLTAKVFSNLVERVLRHTSDSNAVTNLIVTSTRVLVLFFGLFTTLGILNLDKTVASLLAGAGVIGLAVGFAFQEIAANFFSGILIALRKPYRDGDIVQIDQFIGVVTELTLRTTNIRTFGGLEVLVPNKDMFTKAVTNFTRTPDRRVELDIGISYEDDLRKVEKVASEAVEKIEGRLPDKATEFFYRQFGDSSINFQLRFWIEFRHQTDYLRAVHLAIIAIKEAFDANKITIPFPIRTLQFPEGKAELRK
jgi:small conductance mechanosensitive channel